MGAPWFAAFGHAAAAVAGASALRRATRTRRRQARAAGLTALRAVAPLTQPGQLLADGFPAQLPRLSPAEIVQLRSGERVQKQVRDGNTGTGTVVLEVDAPPSLVLDCLRRFEDYEGMIPVVRKSKVASKEEADDGTLSASVEYRISKFWLKLTAVHHCSQEECVSGDRGMVCFDLDQNTKSCVLQSASGFWYVEPCPDGRRSRVWLQVGLEASPLIPKWIIDYAAERALRRATSWMAPYVQELHSRNTQEADKASSWSLLRRKQDDQRPHPPLQLQLSTAY